MGIKSLIRLSSIVLTVALFASCKDDDDTPQPKQTSEVVADTIACEKINTDTTLVDRGEGVDYVFPCRVTVYKKLTIEPGVRIAFKKDAGLNIRVNDNTQDTGIIHAVGTSSDSIWFQGLDGEKWGNIELGTQTLANKLHYCVVEDTRDFGAIITYDGFFYGDIELKYSTIRNNESYGLYCHFLSSIEGFEKNTIHSNGMYPMRIGFGSIADLDGQQSSYYNNGSDSGPLDMINVHSDNLYDRAEIYNDFVVQDPGIPFMIRDHVYIMNNATLTIEAGNELIFDNNEIRTDGANSSISIEGAANNPVIFRSTDENHHWDGFLITSNNPDNSIEHTKIIDAGATAMGGHSNGAGISLGSSSGSAQLTLNNVEIISSKGCGISEIGSTTLNTSNVTFVNNNGSDYCN
jgi:hypothetical protein